MALKNFSRLQKKWITDKRGNRKVVWVKRQEAKKGRLKNLKKKQKVSVRGSAVVIERKEKLPLPRKDKDNKLTEFKESYYIGYANQSQVAPFKKEVKDNGLVYQHSEKPLVGYVFPKSEEKKLKKEVDLTKLN